MKTRAAILIVSILVLLTVSGQSAAQGTAGTVERKVVVSTNPILDMFTWYNGELEFKVATTSTIGISGTYITLDEDEDEEKFMSINAFFRYYAQGEALTGFFFGGRFGIYDVQVIDEDDEEVSETYYNFGIDIGYSWLLGQQKRFAVSLGIGAVRLFGGDLEDVTLTLPTIRLINVGVAF